MHALASVGEYVGFFIKLVAVMDPFFAVPIFLTLTAGRTEAQRRGVARITSMTVLVVLVLAGFAGNTILEILGASLASFRLGGGLVLLLMALAMLNAAPGGVRQTEEEASELESQETMGVVPLAIPLLAGPGAISMVIIEMQQGGWIHRLVIAICILLACLLIWSVLRLAVQIGDRLGTTGLNVANRLLGLLVAAIAIEMMGIGLKELFPILGAAAPSATVGL